jgi:PAS domain S-box-containing protein
MPPSVRILMLVGRAEDVHLVEDALRRAGSEPESRRAETPEDFLAALDAPPDLILADLSLPGLDALTALRLLRQRGLTTPLLLLADPAGEDQAVAALGQGAADYLLRDRPARLGPAVERALARKRQEEEQARRAEQLRLLLEATAEGLYGLDGEGRCTFLNQAGARMLGFSPEDLLGREMHPLIHHSHADRSPYPPEQCPIRRAMQERRGCRVDHEVLWRRDGTAFAAEYASYPLVRGDEVLGAVVRFVDLTERRRLEDQYRQAQKMEAVGRLAGGVAHDFNNLLTVINGYTDLLLGQLTPDHPLRTSLREIRKAGERATALTAQLLAFSRKQVLAPVVLDLNALITETERMLRRLIREDIALTTDLSPDAGPVKTDPGQLQQVLLNLVVNARDAMPRGGSVTITTRNVQLTRPPAPGDADVRPGPHAQLTVKDTGCGMDEETRGHLFEPFFTTKAPGKGTGLGLATVYGIVKQSGGHIEVESEPGRGTTFRIYLPCVEEAVARARPPSLPELFKMPTGAETVLLAEDEDRVRALARLALQSSGYTVLEARDGQEALEVCQRHPGPIHLLVTDVVMPRMSGGELADRLAPLRPGLKVLFLSGYADEALLRHGVAQGERAFLQKPFTPAVLARKVREILDQ